MLSPWGLVSCLSLAVPNAQADPIVQTLTPTPMTASQFNSLYTADDRCLTLGYDFHEHAERRCGRIAGVHGHATPRAGTYAYAYQFGVNNVMDTSIQQPTSVNSASMLFNATPVGTNSPHRARIRTLYVVTERPGRRHQRPAGRARQRRSGPVVDRLAARHRPPAR